MMLFDLSFLVNVDRYGTHVSVAGLRSRSFGAMSWHDVHSAMHDHDATTYHAQASLVSATKIRFFYLISTLLSS